MTVIYSYYCSPVRYVIQKTITHQLCLVCVIKSHIVTLQITAREESSHISEDERHKLEGKALNKLSLGPGQRM